VIVAFLGRHLGVECVLDPREHEVDCKISRLVNGALPREYALNARSERVRESLLHWFHRRGLRYIDFTPPSLPFAERMPRQAAAASRATAPRVPIEGHFWRAYRN
jgi:hypothetical protein